MKNVDNNKRSSENNISGVKFNLYIYFHELFNTESTAAFSHSYADQKISS